ncbi:MAG: thioredoxin [Nanoarchaeota archaeon]|nr:thioredoxin [Nanoarchaeota archaeon]
MEINDKDFNEKVLEVSKQKPVLVDFWAPWCGPCQMLGPIIQEIAKEYTDKISVVKLNIDENKEQAIEYDVMSIPAVKLFKGGKVADEFVGLMDKENIKKFIDKNL